jgi:hypothetical protein
LTFQKARISKAGRTLREREEFSIEEKRILDLLDRGLFQEFPNPGRVGCPDQSVLKGIAYHKIPLSQADQWLNHLSSCTPCFQDFRKYRAEAVAGKRRVFQVALAAAAVLLLVIGGLLLLRNRPAVQTATVTIDLRERSAARGENPPETNQSPIELSRQAKHLVLDLPVGSKEGNYELALLSSSGEEIRTATGVAQLENHTVVLNADMDLAGVLPGSYFLGVRQSGLEWSRYGVRLR